MLGATGSIFGSIFAPLLPQSSWLYPLYHTQQYILEPEWHALALRMAQQRLQRPDQAQLEELRKLRSGSDSPESSTKDEERRGDEQGVSRRSGLDSPDDSIEVDDRNDQDLNRDRVRSDESLPEQDSPRISPVRSDLEDAASTDATFQEPSIRLRPSIENLNDSELQTEQDQMLARRGDLTVKIRLEGTMDLSTKKNQDKENIGQDLTTRRKEDGIDGVEREAVRPRREGTPKPRQVWRPY